MDNSIILRELFVKLGFQVDEQQLQQMEKRVNKVIGIIEGIGTATLASFAFVDKAILQTAKHLQDLHYVSEQTGSSVANIQSMQQGLRQVGLEASDATAMLTGMARAIRLNPGMKGLIAGMGIKTEGRETTQIMDDVLDKLAEIQKRGAGGPALAAQYGSMLGVDPDQLNIILKHRKEIRAAEQEDRAYVQSLGLDPDKVASDSAKLGQDIAKFERHMEIFGMLLVERFLPVVERLLGVFDKVVSVGNKLDKETGGVSTLAAGAVGAAGVGYVGKQLLKFAGKALGRGGAVAAEGAATEGVATAAADTALAGGAEAAGAGLTAVALPEIVALVVAVLAALGLGYLLLHPENAKKFAEAAETKGKEWATVISDNVKKAATVTKEAVKKFADGHVNLSNPMNLRSWGDTPTEEQHNKAGDSIGRFAHFSDDETGLSAMVAQLLRYSDRDHKKTVREIISTMSPKNENRTEALVADASKRIGVAPDQQLNLHDPEQMVKVMDSIIRQEHGREPYSMDALRSAVDYRFGKEKVTPSGSNVTIHQNNDIKVEGSGDPNATARQVHREQRGLGADLVRNFNGAPS